MRRMLAIAAVVTVGCAGWMVIASAVWSWGTSLPFEAPFLQWYQAVALGWWHANWWCKVWILAGGIVSTVTLMAVLYVVTCLYRRRSKTSLYGESQFATPKQMQTGNISTDARPF